MADRLYRVTIPVTYYILAPHENAARDDEAACEEAVNALADATVEAVQPGERGRGGWTRDSGVYGGEAWTSLGDALDALEADNG